MTDRNFDWRDFDRKTADLVDVMERGTEEEIRMEVKRLSDRRRSQQV